MTINSGTHFAHQTKYYSIYIRFKGELLHFYECSEIETPGSFRIKRLVYYGVMIDVYEALEKWYWKEKIEFIEE